MKVLRSLTAGALAVAGISLFAGLPGAAPFSVAPEAAKSDAAKAGGQLVQKVYGCHANKQYHMVYLWGYQAWHRHKGGNCAPVAANPPNTGWVPPIYNPACHSHWENHFHPGWGISWHKHAGPNCGIVRGRIWKNGPRHNCVNILGVWICG